jgi:hypothetical protein
MHLWLLTSPRGAGRRRVSLEVQRKEQMSQIAQPKTAQHQVPMVKSDNPTILLFGPTGAGKTAQIGELAEFYYATYKKRTRLYAADPGGTDTVKPYINLGIIEPVYMFGDNPWAWINAAVRGQKWDAQGKKWVDGRDPDIGLYAFEGMTSMADSLMLWMRDAATKGVNIGGAGAFSFTVGTGTDAIKVGSNNMAHYSVAQGKVYEVSTLSQYLPGAVLWTAGDSRGEDDSNGSVVGPQIAGKAMTGEAPRWFKYTFRIGVELVPNQAPKHVLYTDAHMEMAAKGAKAIANARIPLAGAKAVDVPLKIEPASIVKALELVAKRCDAAEDEIAKRLGIVR